MVGRDWNTESPTLPLSGGLLGTQNTLVYSLGSSHTTVSLAVMQQC